MWESPARRHPARCARSPRSVAPAVDALEARLAPSGMAAHAAALAEISATAVHARPHAHAPLHRAPAHAKHPSGHYTIPPVIPSHGHKHSESINLPAAVPAASYYTLLAPATSDPGFTPGFFERLFAEENLYGYDGSLPLLADGTLPHAYLTGTYIVQPGYLDATGDDPGTSTDPSADTSGGSGSSGNGSGVTIGFDDNAGRRPGS